VFKEFGLPKAIRTDNGVPFASANSLFNLSKLSVWWLRLGIEIERIKPGHPQQNGRHERMHLTLKLETTKPAGKNFLQQQAKFDDFRTRRSTCALRQSAIFRQRGPIPVCPTPTTRSTTPHPQQVAHPPRALARRRVGALRAFPCRAGRRAMHAPLILGRVRFELCRPRSQSRRHVHVPGRAARRAGLICASYRKTWATVAMPPTCRA
jgi:Integrase core domain